jgi:serine/threonine protein kinase
VTDSSDNKTFDELLALARVDGLADRVTGKTRLRSAAVYEPIVLGRFELDRVLGRGSHGVVFAAHDRTLERDVALKVFGRKHAAAHEARMLTRVQHPNIVTLHDLGQCDGFHFLVLARIDGGTMTERVRMGVDWRTVVDLFVQVGRGLAAVHQAEMVHGDVKPGNMLVGSDGRAHLVDFGFAQSLVPRRPRVIVGTREYASPECLDGAATGPWSDQYSFCVGLPIREGSWSSHDAEVSALHVLVDATKFDVAPRISRTEAVNNLENELEIGRERSRESVISGVHRPSTPRKRRFTGFRWKSIFGGSLHRENDTGEARTPGSGCSRDGSRSAPDNVDILEVRLRWRPHLTAATGFSTRDRSPTSGRRSATRDRASGAVGRWGSRGSARLRVGGVGLPDGRSATAGRFRVAPVRTACCSEPSLDGGAESALG